jgi:hypothetical protein
MFYALSSGRSWFEVRKIRNGNAMMFVVIRQERDEFIPMAYFTIQEVHPPSDHLLVSR